MKRYNLLQQSILQNCLGNEQLFVILEFSSETNIEMSFLLTIICKCTVVRHLIILACMFLKKCECKSIEWKKYYRLLIYVIAFTNPLLVVMETN